MHEPDQRNPWVCLKCGRTNPEWVPDCGHREKTHELEQSSGNPGELEALRAERDILKGRIVGLEAKLEWHQRNTESCTNDSALLAANHRNAILAAKLLDAQALHLADESTIYQLEHRIVPALEYQVKGAESFAKDCTHQSARHLDADAGVGRAANDAEQNCPAPHLPDTPAGDQHLDVEPLP